MTRSSTTAVSIAQIVAALPHGEMVDVQGSQALEITGVSQDSRRVEAGDLFVCLPGDNVDGHDFAHEAVGRGAAALMTERELGPRFAGSVTELRVRDARRCVGPVASLVFGEPSRSMQVIGVTGTNGKTTTAALIGAALGGAQRSVEIVGTLSGKRTTPEAVDLQWLLSGFVARGVDTVVMEVSSHALELHRVDGVHFAAVVFTNLGRDHLDLHGSVEAYFAAKARLFSEAFSDLAIINSDDPRGPELIERAPQSMRFVGYSNSDADVVEVGVSSLRINWMGLDVRVPIGGTFNVSNVIAALTVARELGIEPSRAASGIASVGAIDGRFEVFGGGRTGSPTVVVDYAHTPEGLELLLESVRSAVGGAQITVVFGCGGDRDHGKRPHMGRAAVRGADRVIITSDNPRSEPPQVIVEQILDGIESSERSRVIVEHDRSIAIAQAISGAEPGDVVVVAGKGHETDQEIDGVLYPFDDRAVVAELLDRGGAR